MPNPVNHIKTLSSDKQEQISHLLLNGRSAMSLARLIQQEWKELVEVPEKTLTQQLNRLRLDIAKGKVGIEAAAQLAMGKKLEISNVTPAEIDVLYRLTALANLQEKRIERFAVKEVTAKGGKVYHPLNTLISEYRETLITMQRTKFDLGVDEFKGIIPGMRGASVTETKPDGSVTQKQAFEAYGVLENIFSRRLV